MSLTPSQWIERIPKIELHVHLEGSIRPETALELARRHKVDLPGATPEELRRWYRFNDFDKFIQVYLTLTRLLREPEDYELITLELARELARQNVLYAEVTFSPGTHEWLGVPRRVYLEGLARGRRRALDELGVRLNWVFDIVRNAEDWRSQADLTLGVALEFRDEGVVGFGLGGKEAGHPPEPFAPWFERARAAGLHATPHAGETAGAASVLGAMRELGARRIGHGVRAVEDPRVLREAVERGVIFEVCPTSNLMLGVCASRGAHPLKELIRAGVKVTLNTDDPGIFCVDVNEELTYALEMGIGPELVGEMMRNALEGVFLPEEEKRTLTAEFDRRWARADKNFR